MKRNLKTRIAEMKIQEDSWLKIYDLIGAVFIFGNWKIIRDLGIFFLCFCLNWPPKTFALKIDLVSSIPSIPKLKVPSMPKLKLNYPNSKLKVPSMFKLPKFLNWTYVNIVPAHSNKFPIQHRAFPVEPIPLEASRMRLLVMEAHSQQQQAGSANDFGRLNIFDCIRS